MPEQPNPKCSVFTVARWQLTFALDGMLMRTTNATGGEELGQVWAGNRVAVT
jgi:hypothetical protein